MHFFRIAFFARRACFVFAWKILRKSHGMNSMTKAEPNEYTIEFVVFMQNMERQHKILFKWYNSVAAANAMAYSVLLFFRIHSFHIFSFHGAQCVFSSFNSIQSWFEGIHISLAHIERCTLWQVTWTTLNNSCRF